MLRPQPYRDTHRWPTPGGHTCRRNSPEHMRTAKPRSGPTAWDVGGASARTHAGLYADPHGKPVSPKARGQIAAESLRGSLRITTRIGAVPRATSSSASRGTAESGWMEWGLRTLPPVLIGKRLTQREMEVLRLVAQGMSNGEIAKALFISPKTASVHVSRILASWASTLERRPAHSPTAKDFLTIMAFATGHRFESCRGATRLATSSYGAGSSLVSLKRATAPPVHSKYSTTTVCSPPGSGDVGRVRGRRLVEPAVDHRRAVDQHPDAVVAGHAEPVGAGRVGLRPRPARREPVGGHAGGGRALAPVEVDRGRPNGEHRVARRGCCCRSTRRRTARAGGGGGLGGRLVARTWRPRRRPPRSTRARSRGAPCVELAGRRCRSSRPAGPTCRAPAARRRTAGRRRRW